MKLMKIVNKYSLNSKNILYKYIKDMFGDCVRIVVDLIYLCAKVGVCPNTINKENCIITLCH